jgi:hypothetical protein
VLYLPESNCILLYAAWITNKELQNTILFPELLAVDTTADTNIEDRMLMIVTGLENMRRDFPSIRAFLPSECQWVFRFSLSYAFPKLLCVATIRRTKQVTQIQLYAIVPQLIHYMCTNLNQFIFDHIHC